MKNNTRKSVGVLQLLGMIWCLTGLLNAQANTTPKSSQDDFIAEVMQTLDKSNVLRIALEKGDRGDGVHYPWMDQMKKLGIKQVSVVIDFQWNGSTVRTSVTRVSYHQKYYQYNVIIAQPDTLRNIESSNLEIALRTESLCRANNHLSQILKGHPSAKGTAYINLLDDERLPVLYDMPEIDFL